MTTSMKLRIITYKLHFELSKLSRNALLLLRPSHYLRTSRTFNCFFKANFISEFPEINSFHFLEERRSIIKILHWYSYKFKIKKGYSNIYQKSDWVYEILRVLENDNALKFKMRWDMALKDCLIYCCWDIVTSKWSVMFIENFGLN